MSAEKGDWTRRDALKRIIRDGAGLMAAASLPAVGTLVGTHEAVRTAEVPREFSLMKGCDYLWQKTLEDGLEHVGVYVTFKDPGHPPMWVPVNMREQGTHHGAAEPQWAGIPVADIASAIHVHTHPYESGRNEKVAYSRPPSTQDFGRSEMHPSLADVASIRLGLERHTDITMLGGVKVSSGVYFFTQEPMEKLQALFANSGPLDESFMKRLPEHVAVYASFRRQLRDTLITVDVKAYRDCLALLEADAAKIQANPDAPQGQVWPDYADLRRELEAGSDSNAGDVESRAAAREAIVGAFVGGALHGNDAQRAVLERLAGPRSEVAGAFERHISLADELVPAYDREVKAEGHYAEALASSGLSEAAFLTTSDGQRLFLAYQRSCAELGAHVYFRSDDALSANDFLPRSPK